MKLTTEQAADLVLASVELARLGVFDRAQSEQVAAVGREAQVALLDLAALRDRKENPRHRPRGIDSPLLRDKIVEGVLFERAANPDKQMKKIVDEVGDKYQVSRSYVFKCLKQVTPERRRQMTESIIRACFWPEVLAHLYILAAPHS